MTHTRVHRRGGVLACAAAALLGVGCSAQPQPRPVYSPILDGLPVSSFVAYNQLVYYNVSVPLPLPRLLISATASPGSVDLLATMGAFWDPVPDNSEWASVGLFGPSVILVRANASYTTLGRSCEGKAACSLQLAVFGRRASNYSVTLSVGGDTEALSTAVPGVGVLSSEAGFAHFNYTPPAPLTTAVSLTATPVDASNRLALFISTGGGRSPPDPALPSSYCASAVEAVMGSLTGGVTHTLPSTPGPCSCVGQPPPCSHSVTVAVLGGGANSTSVPSTDVLFTLLATLGDAPGELVDGLPASGTGGGAAPPSTFTYTPALGGVGNPAGLELVLSPSLGTVRLALAFGSSSPPPLPGSSSAAYSSSGGPGAQVIRVSARDAVYTAVCPAPGQACPMTVAVWTMSTSSAWSLVATSGQAVSLTDGVPVQGSVGAGGALAYYRLLLSSPLQLSRALLFTSASVSGDAALFIGCDSNNATLRPDPSDPSSYMWSSNGAAGDEVVTIDPTSDAWACRPERGPSCAYYVTVASTDASLPAEFVLLARSNTTSQPTPLTLGAVLLDAVPAQSAGSATAQPVVNRYVLPFDPTASSITASLFNVQGSAALFLCASNATGGGAPPLCPTTGGAPYAVAPTGTSSWEGVIIPCTDPALQLACGVLTLNSTCVLSLSVTANTSSVGGYAQYLLSTSTDVRQVVDGLPLVTTAPSAPGVTYFRYSVPARTPFTVTVTPLTGDPDLLLSVGAKPNATSAQWSSLSPGVEVISVQWTEPWLNPARNPGVTFPVDFYVGVTGLDAPSDFTLLVTANPYVTLLNGIPQAVASKGGILKYFLLQLPATAGDGSEVGFSVALTPITGDPSPLLFLNTVNHTTHSCAHCGWPYCRTAPCDPTDVGDYNRQWSSEEAGNPLFVEVDVTDAYYEPGEAYVIAVLAELDSAFSVTATFSNSITTLSNQIPATGRVNAGAYTWYALTITNTAVVLTVVGTPLDGQPELYVSVNSTDRRPTAAAFDKAAVPGQGSNGLAVVFDWSELPECPDSAADHTVRCHAYIGVRGGGGMNATFTLVADAMKANVTELLLVDGQPQNNVVVQSDSVLYYALPNVPNGTSYSVTLNPLGVAKLDLYATTDGTRPSETNYQYGSVAANGPEQVTVAPGTPGYCFSNCTLRVAVHHPFIDVVGFSITYESSAVSTLVGGQPTEGNTQVGNARYYALPVYTPGAGVDVSLTGGSGAPQLFLTLLPPGAASASFRPLLPAACLAWSGGGLVQTLRVFPGDACYCPPNAPCTYVIGVACGGIPYRDSTCRYMLSGTSAPGTRVQLTDGVPLGDVVDALYSPHSSLSLPYRYFSFDLTILLYARANLTLTVFGTTGQPVQLLASNAVRASPTLAAGGGVWNSNATGPPGISAALVVSATDPAVTACPACTLLTVAVLSPGSATSPVPFILSASSTTGSPQWLSMGQPATPVTAGYKTSKRFVVFLPQGGSGFDLLVLPTLLTGKLSFTVSPADPGVSCFIGPPPNRTVRCEGVWTSADGAPLRISAADPCGNAAPGAPCDPATSWRPGPYYISVFLRWSPTTYVLTASQPDAVLQLLDAVPQVVSASLVGPAQLQYNDAFDAAAPPVRVSLSADGLPVQYFLLSCVRGGGGCGTGPGPANPSTSLTGWVAAYSTVTLTLSAGSPGFCHDGSGGGAGCTYALAVYPSQTCAPPTCAASATVTASTSSGTTPVEVQWSSIDASVFTLGGSLGASAPSSSSSSPVELYLSPMTSGPTDIRVSLSSCGGGGGSSTSSLWPAVYACDPTLLAPEGCGNPYTPGPGSAPVQSTATAVTGPGRGGATATFSLPQTPSSVLFMSVQAARTADTVDSAGLLRQPRSCELPGGGWELALSAGATALVLLAGPPESGPAANVSVAGAGLSQRLVWPLPTLQSYDGTLHFRLAAGAAQYTLFVAPSSFASTAPAGHAVVSETACGLERWAASVAHALLGAFVVPVTPSLGPDGALSIPVAALPVTPGLAYEASIVVRCDRGCAVDSAPASGLPGVGTFGGQRAAFGAVRFVAEAGVPPPAPTAAPAPPSALLIGLSVGGGLCALLVVGVAVGVVRLRHPPDAAYRKAAGGAGLLAVVQEWDDAGGRRGEGAYDPPRVSRAEMLHSARI